MSLRLPSSGKRWRRVAGALLSLTIISPVAAEESQPAPLVGSPLPVWSDGELDIHHIHTGRGDALFFIFPDGTTLLNDASGRTAEKAPFSYPTRPDDSRPPAEWVARYVRNILPTGALGIDYALISHFHGDHMGVIEPQSPVTALGGDYQLSGITQIAEQMPITRLLDRSWPHYRQPDVPANATMANYQRFIDWQVQHRGLQMRRFEAGRHDQIRLLHAPKDYPQFELRNLYANGYLWTGEGNGFRSVMPHAQERGALSLDENKLSAAFRLRYGAFDYFSGGDLSSIDEHVMIDPPAWLDVETPVAKASGPVDVLKANHHGSWDANGIAFLAALQPRVLVVTPRADGHPAVNTYRRMTSQRVWPGPRDIFLTHLSSATATTTYGVAEAGTPQGHIVVRVAPGGERYRVFVLDDRDERRTVKAIFGPYSSR